MLFNLVTAIQTAFANNTALMTTFPDGLWFGLAPDASQAQNCRLTVVSSVPEYETTNGSKRPIFETIVIQIDVFGPTANFVLTALQQVDTLYNYKALAISGDYYLTGYRNAGPKAMKQDEIVWHGYSTYLFITSNAI